MEYFTVAVSPSWYQVFTDRKRGNIKLEKWSAN